MKNNPLSNYGKYSAVAIQMVVVVILCVWGGMKLDDWLETQTPYWTVGLTVFGITAALYYLFKAVKS